MNKVETIMFLRNYQNKYLRKPNFITRRSLFVKDSYSNWTIEELIKEIKKSSEEPIVTIEKFVEKMGYYACINIENIQFSIAEDVAEHIYELLYLERR